MNLGSVSKTRLYSDGRGWGYYCDKAGYQIDKRNARKPDEDYFRNLKNFVESEGRLPRTSERRLAGLNFRNSRWATLQIFLEDAASQGYIPKEMLGVPLEEPDTSGDKPTALPAVQEISQQDRPVPPIPAKTRRKNWERIDLTGHPYAPHDESGVVAIFGILCANGTIPWQILTLNSGKGIDSICYDEKNGREIKVELKYKLSKAGWNHKFDSFDYLVCWECKWKAFPKPVIELKDMLKRQRGAS